VQTCEIRTSTTLSPLNKIFAIDTVPQLREYRYIYPDVIKVDPFGRDKEAIAFLGMRLKASIAVRFGTPNTVGGLFSVLWSIC
jgi:hypothetical protein